MGKLNRKPHTTGKFSSSYVIQKTNINRAWITAHSVSALSLCMLNDVNPTQYIGGSDSVDVQNIKKTVLMLCLTWWEQSFCCSEVADFETSWISQIVI